MHDPYLKITLNDNDFTSYYHQLGTAIQNVFLSENSIPEKEDLENIKPWIAKLWHAMHNLHMYSRFQGTAVGFSETSYDYFEKNLKLDIVNFPNIVNFNDYQDIYIPLFDNNEIICK